MIRIQRDHRRHGWSKLFPSVPEPKSLYDELEVLTWGVHCRVKENVNPKTELPGGNCIQGAPNPFVLPRYRVCSVVERMSGGIQINE